MAIRYDSASRLGEIDIVDNTGAALDKQGRPNRVRFGGKGGGNRTLSDVFFEFDGPNQLGIRFPNLRESAVDVRADKIVYSSNAVDVEMYLRDGDEQRQNEFQFDALLKTRAAANAAATFVLQYVGHENFDFDYMTPIAEVYTEVLRGKVWVYNYDRAAYLADPTSVVPGIGRQTWYQGGYHVKHKTWTNWHGSRNYCILSRPLLTAADNSESWGTMSFNPVTGEMTYSFDAAFLATAPLPIRVDPTFGYTSVGGDTFPMSEDRALGSIFTLSESATGVNLYIYCTRSGAAQNIKGIVYDVSAGDPNARQEVGAAVAVPNSPAWATSAISGSYSAADFYLGYVSDGHTGQSYKDASGTPQTKMANGTLTYTAPEATWPGTDANYDGQSSIYMDYTVAGGTINTVTLSDAITNALMADSNVAQRHRNRLLTDTETLADTLLEERLRQRLISDTVDLSDLVTEVRIKGRTLEDAIDLVDSITAVQRFRHRMLSDATGLSDENLSLRIRWRLLTDPLTLADSAIENYISGGVTIVERTLTDTLEAADSNLVQRFRDRLLTDAEGITDGGIIERLRNRLGSDNVTVTDFIVDFAVRNVRLGDTVELVDGELVFRLRNRTAEDSIDLAGSLLPLRLRERLLDDTIDPAASIIPLYIPFEAVAVRIRLSDDNLFIVVEAESNPALDSFAANFIVTGDDE